MHTLNQFEAANNSGIVVLKEIVDGAPRYRYVTAEEKLLAHVNMSFNEGDGDLVETNHEQGSYAAIDIMNGEALQLEMRYFRGVCEAVAYSISPRESVVFGPVADIEQVFCEATAKRFEAGESLEAMRLKPELAEAEGVRILQVIEVPDNEAARVIVVVMIESTSHVESVSLPKEAVLGMITESDPEDAVGMTVMLNDVNSTTICIELAPQLFNLSDLHESEMLCTQRVNGYMIMDTLEGVRFLRIDEKPESSATRMVMPCDLLELRDCDGRTTHEFYLTKEA